MSTTDTPLTPRQMVAEMTRLGIAEAELDPFGDYPGCPDMPVGRLPNGDQIVVGRADDWMDGPDDPMIGNLHIQTYDAEYEPVGIFPDLPLAAALAVIGKLARGEAAGE